MFCLVAARSLGWSVECCRCDGCAGRVCVVCAGPWESSTNWRGGEREEGGGEEDEEDDDEKEKQIKNKIKEKEEGREKERVLGFMRQNTDPDSQGIAFERILRELSPVGLTHEKIRNALNLLLDEGNIYTTIDDSTYAVTE